jgi:formylmethanofuran dehydrogenase subunit D
MPTEFTPVSGQTSRQGTSLNESKYSDSYRSEINNLLMNPQDMARFELPEGDPVRTREMRC